MNRSSVPCFIAVIVVVVSGSVMSKAAAAELFSVPL